jgi:hypothetical protein
LAVPSGKRPENPLGVGWTATSISTGIGTTPYTGAYDELNTTGAFKQTVNGAPYVYSQFEAIYARRVFPCLDEPDNKVSWQLTLDVPAGLVAVSNAPIVRELALAAGRKRVQFAAPRPLPSYLVAFGVGPFDVVDAGKTARGTPIRVITMNGRGAEAAWAARTSPRVLELLEARHSRYPGRAVRAQHRGQPGRRPAILSRPQGRPPAARPGGGHRGRPGRGHGSVHRAARTGRAGDPHLARRRRRRAGVAVADTISDCRFRIEVCRRRETRARERLDTATPVVWRVNG